MPELPDLEVFAKNLDNHLSGKKLKKINIKNKSKLKSTSKEIKSAIEGSTLEKIFRDGKELRFRFSNSNVLGLHMMLRGRLNYFTNKNEFKYTILELIFADGTGLALTDFQRNARATLNPEPSKVPDALSKKLNSKYLADALNRNAAIKNVLLDQDVIRGIGNAYADEILWKAKISPFSVSRQIPPARIKALEKSIRQVLAWGEKEIRKADPDIIGGEVRDFMKIHNPSNKKSPTGAAIKKKSGSRKTYYTNEQVLYK